MADVEKKPWDQMDGETNRWYQRFSTYRLAGPGRSVLGIYAVEWAKSPKNKNKPRPKSISGSWSYQVKEFHWAARAEAYDQYLNNLAASEQEAAWRKKIMSQAEAQARMSEFGRNDMRQFYKVVERWTDKPLPSEEIIDERKRIVPILGEIREYLVKKVVIDMEAFIDPERSFRVAEFKDSPKDGISIKLHSAPAAIKNIGDYSGAFTQKPEEDVSEAVPTISIPADIIAPSFLAPYRDIRDNKHIEYVFHGGRGSTKSSFESLVFIALLVNHPAIHGIALRQVADTLRDSVYAQLDWAINELDAYYPGLSDKFKRTTSPLEITYKPTGQKIYFRGADDPGNIKSIKPKFGYIGIAWFEELDQFHGPEAIRKIEQSAIRGGDTAFIFKSFNPPPTSSNWANKYVKVPKDNQYIHFSSYLDVPPEWLGKAWIDEAEYLKTINLKAYEHEYLGIPSSAGGTVFENVKIERISDEQIAQFDHVLWGGDWGWYPDPADFGPVHFDAARRILYIFGEYRAWKQNNLELYKGIVNKFGLTAGDTIIADSAEPKSVADFRQYSTEGIEAVDENGLTMLDAKGKPVMIYGPSCRGAEKGPDSVKYSIKWLQGLSAIVIDKERAPYAAEEFLDYEYEQDPDGNFISEYPDKNNHSIDRVRYATNLIWRKRGK